METFFWSLLLAAISALSYVAYRHPVPFRSNIAYPLIWISIIGIVFIMASTFGSQHVLVENIVKESKNLNNNEYPMLLFSINSLAEKLRTLYLALGIGGGIVVYLLLLVNLPKILSIEETKVTSNTSLNRTRKKRRAV